MSPLIPADPGNLWRCAWTNAGDKAVTRAGLLDEIIPQAGRPYLYFLPYPVHRLPNEPEKEEGYHGKV